MGTAESLDGRLLAVQVNVGDGTPREVDMSDRFPFFASVQRSVRPGKSRKAFWAAGVLFRSAAISEN